MLGEALRQKLALVTTTHPAHLNTCALFAGVPGLRLCRWQVDIGQCRLMQAVKSDQDTGFVCFDVVESRN